MQTFLSSVPGGAANGVSLDNTRRLYNFGDRIARLSAQESLFLSYIMMLSKQSTDDPVFKHLEERDQWHRRRVRVVTTTTQVLLAANLQLTGIELASPIDKYGRELSGSTVEPSFVLPSHTMTLIGQIETAAASDTFVDARFNIRVDAQTASAATKGTYTVTLQAINGDTNYAVTHAGKDVRVKAYVASTNEQYVGTVIGSVFAEATGAPDGWTDELYNREGYTQIFKTSIPIVSGTAQATRYRGRPNELARIWAPKMREHKLDMSRSALFNVGGVDVNGKRQTTGYLPYIEQYGYVQNFTYASSTYDDVMEFFQYFLEPDRMVGSKAICFTSRKIIAWANKLGDAGFLKNTVGASAYQIKVDNLTGAFGHNITRVWTPFGTVGFVEETQLKAEFADYAIMCNPANVKWRPLAANGVSRDTFVKTNVQGNDVDGRKDLITTEAGLQIDLPETHALWKFS